MSGSQRASKYDFLKDEQLELVVERNEREQLMKMAYKQTKEERKKLLEEVNSNTMKRLTEVNGGNLQATYGEQ